MEDVLSGKAGYLEVGIVRLARLAKNKINMSYACETVQCKQAILCCFKFHACLSKIVWFPEIDTKVSLP